MQRPYKLPNIPEFSSKEKLKKYISNYLKSQQASGNDQPLWVHELFKYHYDYERRKEKLSKIIIYHTLANNCFATVNEEGVIQPFSYKSCITHPNKLLCAHRAFRTEIIDQIYHFKDNAISICGICDNVVYKPDAEVDHHPLEFEKILKKFLEKKQLKLVDVEVVKRPSEWSHFSVLFHLSNQDLSNEWKSYHREVAQYQLVHPECHVTKTSRNL